MTTITKERAEIKSFITGFLSDPAHDNQSSDSLLANVFRIALASLEAEPVSQTYKLNEPSGNSPVTPDGWISCSERMPKGYADVLVTDGEHVEVKWWDESGYWNSWTELNSDIFADEITHWMPLPEPPQEVNRG